MKTKKLNQQGFTLIELLVVIAIIAILASVSVPALQTAQLKAKQSKALQQAKGISQALRAWSVDEDGLYPDGTDANEAFAQLFEEGMTEEVFYVSGSAWHGTGNFRKGPDEQYGEYDEVGGAGKALDKGENHWAFNHLATADSRSRYPLIADGFSNSVGTYASLKTELGGIWRGKTAIVIYCGGNAKVEKLDKTYKLINEVSGNDTFTDEGVEMLNPATP